MNSSVPTPTEALPWSAIVPVDDIQVKRDERQRTELTNIEELADSILRRGLMQPIVVTRDLILVAGERRLTAHKHAGLDTIKITFSDEMDEGELQALELEENVKRVDLPWKDNCLAVASYHAYRVANDPNWDQKKTSDALGISPGEISQRLEVAKELRNGNKLVADAPRLSTAKGIVQRALERREASETSQLMALVSAPIARASGVSVETAVEQSLEPGATGFILNVDFLEWAETYDGPKFNFLHCDFPYGVGMHKSDQGSGDAHGTYLDTPEVYWALVDGMLAHLDNFLDESAHLVFWFSMDYYTETFARLSERFRVSPFPLIWHKSDGAGIIPDPNRGPRRTYETAFFASRGDRKIVRPVANSVAAGITRGRHMSEKSQDVLRHFFRMLVDENTALLDPTCGSGSAIRAGVASGAGRYLGLELNTEFANHADEVLAKFLEEGDEK